MHMAARVHCQQIDFRHAGRDTAGANQHLGRIIRHDSFRSSNWAPIRLPRLPRMIASAHTVISGDRFDCADNILVRPDPGDHRLRLRPRNA